MNVAKVRKIPICRLSSVTRSFAELWRMCVVFKLFRYYIGASQSGWCNHWSGPLPRPWMPRDRNCLWCTHAANESTHGPLLWMHSGNTGKVSWYMRILKFRKLLFLTLEDRYHELTKGHWPFESPRTPAVGQLLLGVSRLFSQKVAAHTKQDCILFFIFLQYNCFVAPW